MAKITEKFQIKFWLKNFGLLIALSLFCQGSMATHLYAEEGYDVEGDLGSSGGIGSSISSSIDETAGSYSPQDYEEPAEINTYAKSSHETGIDSVGDLFFNEKPEDNIKPTIYYENQEEISIPNYDSEAIIDTKQPALEVPTDDTY